MSPQLQIKKNSTVNFLNFSDGNPWAVNDASAFLRYCCPECDYNNEDLKGFSDHAIENHERSSTLFPENSNFNHQGIVPSGLNKSGVPLDIYVKQEEEQEQPDFEPYLDENMIENSDHEFDIPPPGKFEYKFWFYNFELNK